MENEMSTFDSSATETILERPRGNRSRKLDLPRLTKDSDVILYCITVADVDELCKENDQPLLSDDEMERLFIILTEDFHWFYNLYDAVDQLRDGALRRGLVSRLMHADALV